MQDFLQNDPVLIDRPPKPEFPPRNRHHNLVEMPDITGTGLPPAQVPGDPGPEFRHPSPDRLVRNINAALQEHFFDLAQGKIETNVEPNRVRNELRRKAMAFVTDGRRSHGGPLRDAAFKAKRRVNVTTPA